MNRYEMVIPAVGWRPYRHRFGLDVAVMDLHEDTSRVEEAKRRVAEAMDIPYELIRTKVETGHRSYAVIRCFDGALAQLVEGDTFSVNAGTPSEIVLRFQDGVIEEKIPDLDAVREMARQERWRMEHQTCEDLPVVLPSTIVCPCGASYLPGQTIDL